MKAATGLPKTRLATVATLFQLSVERGAHRMPRGSFAR